MCTHESHDALEAALRSRDYVLKQFGLKAAPTYTAMLVRSCLTLKLRPERVRGGLKPPLMHSRVATTAVSKETTTHSPCSSEGKPSKSISSHAKGGHIPCLTEDQDPVRPVSPDPPLAAATPKAPAPEAPTHEEDESRYNEDAELRRRDKAETSRQAEPRGESVATSQPDAATQALLQTVELLTQQVKHMQDREYERRRSRSRDRRRRTRSDSRGALPREEA